MNQRKLNYSDILQKELQNKELMTSQYAKWFELHARVINILIELSYILIQPPSNKNSSDYEYFCHVQYQYYDLVASLRAALLLFETCNYAEAFRKARGLLETLVKLRYFLHHKDDLLSYEKNGKVKDPTTGKLTTLRIKKIFNEVLGADDAYDKYYGGLLSKYVHDNIAVKLVTIAHRKNAGGHILLVSYNKQEAEAFINHMLYLLLGYVHLFQTFMNIDESTVIQEVGQEYVDVKDQLIFILRKHKQDFKQQEDLHMVFSKIIDIKI